jgi:hypothetical protein
MMVNGKREGWNIPKAGLEISGSKHVMVINNYDGSAVDGK